LSSDIVLTADSTLMSDYHNNEFLGFGACAPPNVIPDFLFRQMFFPPVKNRDGKPVEAPYGLRKIESQLIREGFDVCVTDPKHLGKYLEHAKVLGIHVMDPFGLGPASSTFAYVLQKEPFLAYHFRQLMDRREIQLAKQNKLKIIVGGPGTWQFHYRPDFAVDHGIDCIVEGEAENVVGKLFMTALEGEELPTFYETTPDESPSLNEIPNIVAPSINGLVEVGRGCCRGCSFCSVTLRPLRWYPIEKIIQEIEVNQAGGVDGALLHTDDVMLYGSHNTLPNDEKLIELTEAVSKKASGVTWSHCSLAAVAAKPALFSKVSEIIRQKQSWWGVEIGVETGSPALVSKVMPAKAHPFKPEEWPNVVKAGMGLMHDNGLVPAGTLMVGVPEEVEEDVIKTIELIDDLKGFRSLIVPLFFVPMGRLKDRDWFRDTEVTELHKELLVKCMEHDFYWVDSLLKLSFPNGLQRAALKPFFNIFVSLLKYKARREGIHIN
jgi:radical SAM superfamily enzyme YgiQ (UPF0313 family)